MGSDGGYAADAGAIVWRSVKNDRIELQGLKNGNCQVAAAKRAATWQLPFFSCASHSPLWQSAWPDETIEVRPSGELDLQARAISLNEQVRSPESCRAAIEAWEELSKVEPATPSHRIQLACLRLLEGAAYAPDRQVKMACYLQALVDCEAAMSFNGDFLQQVKAGSSIGMACQALGTDEMAAMHFWVTGVCYLFRDCLGFWSRPPNFHKKTGDDEASRVDLEIVAEHDLRNLSGHPAWNHYFREDARRLLAEWPKDQKLPG